MGLGARRCMRGGAPSSRSPLRLRPWRHRGASLHRRLAASPHLCSARCRLASSLLSGELKAEGAQAAPAGEAAGDPFAERDLKFMQDKLRWALEPGSLEAAAAAAAGPPPLEFNEVQHEAARLVRSLNMVRAGAPAEAPRGTAPAYVSTRTPSLLVSVLMARLALPPPLPPAPQAALEPPIPGLCSQPGADLAAYEAVKCELELLTGSVFALKAACDGGCLAEVGAAAGLTAAQLQELQAALAEGLGLAAAACARAGEALACMPVLGPCHGEPVMHTVSSCLCCQLAVCFPRASLSCRAQATTRHPCRHTPCLQARACPGGRWAPPRGRRAVLSWPAWPACWLTGTAHACGQTGWTMPWPWTPAW